MLKKLVALSLVTALTLSTASAAFAASLPAGDTPVDGVGEGVGIADAEITEFTVPTDEAFDFYYDPQGLTSIADGESAKLSELAGGTIVMKGTNAPEFINQSGFDVEVEAAFTITNDDLIIVTAKAGIESETVLGTPDKNALFYVQPSTVDVIVTGAENGYVPTEKGIVVPEDGVELVFALPAADYTITNTAGVYEAELIDDTVHGNALNIGGYVNPNADYSAVTDTKLSVAFTVTKKAIADDIEYDDGVVAFGLVKPGTPYTLVEPVVVVEPEPAPVGFTDAGGTATSSKEYEYKKSELTDDGLSIPFNFGDETVTGFKSPSDISYVLNTDYTVTANAFVITKTRLDNISNGGPRGFKIELSNGKTYILNLTTTE